MPEDQPPAPPHSTVLEAANQLLPALAELDQLQQRLSELQNKSARLTEQTLALSRLQARGWTDARHQELVRLDAAANSLELKLASVRRGMARQRRRFESALARFRTAFFNHDTQLIDLQLGTGRMNRQNAALDRTLRYLVRTMSERFCDESGEDGFEVPEQSHPYIPIGIGYFLDMLCRLDRLLTLDPGFLHPTQRYRGVSFLEVGSGSGRNMMLVKASEILLCDSVRGFDINPDQIAEGEALFSLGGALQVADALSFDYAGHDVIFSYRPFSDLALQQRLEAHMAETMSPGSYLLAPLSYDLSLYASLAPMDSHGDIWRKSGPDSAVDA